MCTAFFHTHYSNLLLLVSCGLHISLYYTQLCSEAWNAAADSGDGCLHSGKYEIKRKCLINWQQAPQEREARDGKIDPTWECSSGPLRRGWWMYSRWDVRLWSCCCSACAREICMFVLHVLSFSAGQVKQIKTACRRCINTKALLKWISRHFNTFWKQMITFNYGCINI